MLATDNQLNLNMELWKYKSPTTIMVPYRQAATNFYPEDFLVSEYCRLVQENLLNIIYPGMNIAHLNDFIRYMSTHATLICLVVKDGEIVDTAGLGYITEVDGVDGARKAGFGFGFHRAWHGTQEARTLSWFMLSWWLTELKIDVLFGTTLKANGLAKNFSMNFGFKGHTNIEHLFFRNGELQDATIMWLTKNDFEPLYQAWRETWDVIEAPVESVG